MTSYLKTRLTQLSKIQPLNSLYHTIQRGIEKEALRVTPKGTIAQTPHPESLGSALTHPYITTDFSESLLEFITPPLTDVNQVIDWLELLHYFTYQHIDNEILWANSMPCLLTGDDDIPIANYGTSNLGQMKHIYRKGLTNRYGKNMQAIAGLHVNISFPKVFWQNLHKVSKSSLPLQHYIDQGYFGLIRNYTRYSGLLTYLFGATPAISSSYQHKSSIELETLNTTTQIKPNATSLRMSKIGYQNEEQSHLVVSYESVKKYTQDLLYATSTADPRYSAIGVYKNNQMIQLNTHILQIEAEYYSAIRPKRTTTMCERPIHALQARGVEYIELRGIDANPFYPVGISQDEILFLELFLLYCLLTDSPNIDDKEQQEININQRKIVEQGRMQNLKLYKNGQTLAFSQWTQSIMDDLSDIAAALDQDNEQIPYTLAFKHQQNKINHPEKLPSAQIINALKGNQTSFIDLTLQQSLQHKQYFMDKHFSNQKLDMLKQEAIKSLQKQKQIEDNDNIDLATYIKRYFSGG